MPLFSHISRSNSVAGNAEISVSSISFPKSGAKSENKSGEGLRCLPLGEAKLPSPMQGRLPTAEQRSPHAGRGRGKCFLKTIATCEARLGAGIS